MRHLIVFIKNPKKGKVKTRLAATVGEERALEVYLQLLNVTRKAAEGVDCHRHLFYSDEIDVEDMWDESLFTKHLQEGDDLGERMTHAFKTCFGQGAESTVIIGSDCPQMIPKILQDAFTALENSDMVIGPATDGGYYLLGMKSFHERLFLGKAWSTSSVLHDTMRDAESLGLTVHQLPTLSDIDNAADLDGSRDLLS